MRERGIHTINIFVWVTAQRRRTKTYTADDRKGREFTQKNQSHLWEPNVERFSNFPLKMLRRARLVWRDGESLSKTTWLHWQSRLFSVIKRRMHFPPLESERARLISALLARNWITTGLSCHSEMSRFIASQIVSRLQPHFVSERRRREKFKFMSGCKLGWKVFSFFSCSALYWTSSSLKTAFQTLALNG